MDAESPHLLERLRHRAAIKAVLLRRDAEPGATEVLFERKTGNTEYLPPLREGAAAITIAGSPRNESTAIEIYGRPCYLLTVTLAEKPLSPHALAIVAADDGDPAELAEFIRNVVYDYWYGSSFWK